MFSAFIVEGRRQKYKIRNSQNTGRVFRHGQSKMTDGQQRYYASPGDILIIAIMAIFKRKGI